MRPSTRITYDKIYKLFDEGIPPKKIVHRLNLLSVYVVYGAIRNRKCYHVTEEFLSPYGQMNKIQQIRTNTAA